MVYCAGPHCNGADVAALKLAELGRPVKMMLGGLTGWEDEGYAFVSVMKIFMYHEIFSFATHHSACQYLDIAIQKSKIQHELSRWQQRAHRKETACNVNRPRSAQTSSAVLRPDSIKQARQQLAEGIIDAAQLREIENNAIRHLVQQQCDCGLHVVTDGEFRRAWWHFDFFDGLQGVERYDAEQDPVQRRADQRTAFASPASWRLATTRCWRISAI